MHVCVCNCELPLTNIKDEGVAESVVSVVTSVDQELCVWEHSAAVPAVTHKHKLNHTNESIFETTAEYWYQVENIFTNLFWGIYVIVFQKYIFHLYSFNLDANRELWSLTVFDNQRFWCILFGTELQYPALAAPVCLFSWVPSRRGGFPRCFHRGKLHQTWETQKHFNIDYGYCATYIHLLFIRI